MRVRMSAGVAVVVCVLGAWVAGQAGRGEISGVVVDPTGGVLPGVKVTLLQQQHAQRTTVTNETGAFSFAGIVPGAIPQRKKSIFSFGKN